MEKTFNLMNKCTSSTERIKLFNTLTSEEKLNVYKLLSTSEMMELFNGYKNFDICDYVNEMNEIRKQGTSYKLREIFIGNKLELMEYVTVNRNPMERYIDDKFMNFTSQNSFQSRKKIKEYKPLSELNELTDIPVEVQSESDKIYKHIDVGVKRKSKQEFAKYMSYYKAYNACGYAVIPQKLASDIGLDPKKIKSANKKHTEFESGYKNEEHLFLPVDYIPFLCVALAEDDSESQKINPYSDEDTPKLAFTIDEMKDMLSQLKRLLYKEPYFYQENPVTVAGGFIKFYIITNIVSNPEVIHKIHIVIKCSSATIETMFKKISKAINA